ncbi:MAG: response regulator [Synergistaceae bacterium]|nr:response regulator [Synergistaceae bacterium]MBQ7168808.1 response regulator [Synergistaceae bacterium]
MTAVNISEAFLEITVLPFLFVLSAFLGGRMATKSEINRRFRLLVASTLAAACCEVVIEFLTDMKSVIVWRKIFYASINVNGYCLMCYLAAYTRRITKRFAEAHFFILVMSIIIPFVFHHHGDMFMIFSPGIGVLFVLEGFVLQLLYQEYYGNGQFIVMNTLFILLIDSFITQYLFKQNLPLVYTVATIMLVFTFFYLEAPTYRQLLSAQNEIEEARLMAEDSMRKAGAANKAKSNFLASTSHEIRTPMNAILGINEMIYSEAKDYETRKASNDIKVAGEHLLNIVNNILDISKIEAGKMELYESDYHLWEILKDCEGYITGLIGKKAGIKFILNAEGSMPEHLHGDSLRLKQVLTNLLSNSAKYTEKGSISLNVSCDSADRRNPAVILKFVVEDTGIGMRENESVNVFEPFERANIVETRHIPGAGLGLALVKNIINIMSGRISLESEYGKGTRITFEVPQRVVHGDNITIREYEDMMHNAVPVEAVSDEEPSVWPGAKILVVDDTPVNLVVAKGMLKESMADIETAESGEEALDKIKAGHYDMVFLDHKMPGMDGVETLGHAKKYAPDTAFIALTANAGGNARAEYIAMGFDDYLPKPFKSLEMMKLLREFLNKKK